MGESKRAEGERLLAKATAALEEKYGRPYRFQAFDLIGRLEEAEATLLSAKHAGACGTPPTTIYDESGFPVGSVPAETGFGAPLADVADSKAGDYPVPDRVAAPTSRPGGDSKFAGVCYAGTPKQAANPLEFAPPPQDCKFAMAARGILVGFGIPPEMFKPREMSDAGRLACAEFVRRLCLSGDVDEEAARRLPREYMLTFEAWETVTRDVSTLTDAEKAELLRNGWHEAKPGTCLVARNGYELRDGTGRVVGRAGDPHMPDELRKPDAAAVVAADDDPILACPGDPDGFRERVRQMVKKSRGQIGIHGPAPAVPPTDLDFWAKFMNPTLGEPHAAVPDPPLLTAVRPLAYDIQPLKGWPKPAAIDFNVELVDPPAPDRVVGKVTARLKNGEETPLNAFGVTPALLRADFSSGDDDPQPLIVDAKKD